MTRTGPASGEADGEDAGTDGVGAGNTQARRDVAADPAAGDGEARPAHSRRSLYLLLSPIVVLTVLSYVGDALAPTLVTSHPVWLVLLNARKRYLVLASPQIDVVTFVVVGVGRQLLSDPLYFFIGRRYGDAGVRWLERKLGDGAAGVTMFEGWFKKAAYPMVAIAPNPIICVLAGASKMKTGIFVALNLSGTIVTIVLLRIFGDVFSSPLEGVLGFLRRYQWPLTAVSVLLVVVQVVMARKGGRSELETVSTLERELEQARAETEEGGGRAGVRNEGDGPTTGAGGR